MPRQGSPLHRAAAGSERPLRFGKAVPFPPVIIHLKDEPSRSATPWRGPDSPAELASVAVSPQQGLAEPPRAGPEPGFLPVP